MSDPFQRFKFDDLIERPTPAVLKELVLDLMLSWPMLEQGLTFWMAFARGVTVSKVAAEIGVMSNRIKIQKLKDLYTDSDDHTAVDLLENVAK